MYGGCAGHGPKTDAVVRVMELGCEVVDVPQAYRIRRDPSIVSARAP